MTVVLNASALLALLLDEPGEIVSHYAKLGAARTDIEAMLRPLPVQVLPVDAGMLRRSLWSRVCPWATVAAWHWRSGKGFRHSPRDEAGLRSPMQLGSRWN